jgi:type II secretory ATPase GspE/PulE/Tfp pilus assembly ATPase PilB-like protein
MVATAKRRARLGDMLIARGIITQEQLAGALDVQQHSPHERLLGEILVDLGCATTEQVLSAVAESCGVPYARLTAQLVDADVRDALPDAFIQKHGVLPLFRVRDVLTVAVSEPANLFLVDEIAHAAGLNTQIVAATEENIYQMLDETRGRASGAADAADEAAPALRVTGEVAMPDDYDSVYGNWPPQDVAALLVREAVRARASAIHLEPDEKVLRIRFRIDGALHIVMRPPARLTAALAAAFDEMVGAGAKGAAADGRRSARLLVHGRAVQVHVAALRGALGPRTVVRLVRDDEAQKSLEKLGCDFELLAHYRQLLDAGRGLVLVAGPRESGGTTTLYSSLGALDPIRLNVCTLENAINFSLPGVNQFSASTCGLPDAADVLPRLLMQQPDVLALDDVMGPGAAAAAVDAAQDGCLVLARVRARDAADALARLASWVAPEEAARAVTGVLAQRLVRTVCLHCREEADPPLALRRRVAAGLGEATSFVRGRGCDACARTGFQGRIGLFELAPVTPDIAAMVHDGADAGALRRALRAAGCPSLRVDGLNKVRAGITPAEETLAVLADCPDDPPRAPTAAPCPQPACRVS